MTDSSASHEKERYNAYIGQIARGVGVSSAGQGVGRILGYATQVALARMYGPAQLGFYVLGMTLVRVANVLSQIGMDNGVVRYVAHHEAEGDTNKVRSTIVQALLATFALSVALSILMFLGAGFLADRVFDKPFLETMFEAFSVSIPFFTLMSMALWATQGFQTVKYATYVQEVLRPLSNLAFVVVFYLFGVEVLGAVAAYVLSMALGAVLALYYLRRVFPGLLNREVRPKFESRVLFAASGPISVVAFAQQVNPWIGLLVLGAFETAWTVGVYNAAFRTAALSTLVLLAFGGIFSPMVSGLYRRGLMRDLAYLYKDVSRWAFTAALAFFLVTALLARDVMAVFGEEFVSGWPVLVLIAAAQLFSSSVGPAGRVLVMTGHQRILMFNALGVTATTVVLNLLLVPIFGTAAVAAVAVVSTNVVAVLFVHHSLGFWPYDAQISKPAIAGLLAFVAVYLTRMALPDYSGIPALLVFAPLFLAVFLALLVALGLGPSDRQFLASFRNAVRRTYSEKALRKTLELRPGERLLSRLRTGTVHRVSARNSIAGWER